MNQVRMGKVLSKGSTADKMVQYQIEKEGEEEYNMLFFVGKNASNPIKLSAGQVYDPEWRYYKAKAYLQHLESEVENEYK